MNRRNLIACATASLAFGPAFAQDVARSQLITIFVPFPPGGPTDQMARVLAEAITDRTGQAVIVDNKPGAGGQIAASAAKQAPAGNLNLLIGDWAILGSNAALYKKFSYDPLTDFQPVTPLLSFPMVLYVPASNSATNLKELMAQGKAMTFASQGPGTAGHILGSMLKRQYRADLVHVPYKGSGPAMLDLLAGQVNFLFDGLPAGLQYVQSGKLKALAVMSDRRSPLLPNVPTAAEEGIPDLRMDVWFGIVAANTVAKPAVARLNQDFAAALASPKVTDRFKGQGFNIVRMGTDQFGTYMKSEFDRWAQVIRSNDISVE